MNGFYRDMKLGAPVFENAAVMPPRKCADGEANYYGGVVDCKGKYVESSAQLRDNVRNMYGAYEALDVEEVDKEAVYIGLIENHWGHFMLEYVSRLWYVLENPGMDVVYVATKDLIKELGQFWELLGLDTEKFMRVEKPTRFRKVIVPDISASLREFYTDKFLDVYERIAANVEAASFDKVYFTRTVFDYRMKGEESLEEYFRVLGYEVIAPETLPVREQIAIVKGCKEFASIIGTTSHNLLFANKGVKAILLERASSVNAAQLMVNEIGDVQADVIDVNRAPLPVDDADGPFLVGVNDDFVSYCRDHGLPEPKIKEIGGYDKLWFLLRWKVYYLDKKRKLNKDVDWDEASKLIAETVQTGRFWFEVKRIFYRVLQMVTMGRLRKEFKFNAKAMKSVRK